VSNADLRPSNRNLTLPCLSNSTHPGGTKTLMLKSIYLLFSGMLLISATASVASADTSLDPFEIVRSASDLIVFGLPS
jgi:hypothetical protein